MVNIIGILYNIIIRRGGGYREAVRENYRIGVPTKGKLTEIFNSDKVEYGGSGISSSKPIKIDKETWNGREFSAALVLPPLAVTVYKLS